MANNQTNWHCNAIVITFDDSKFRDNLNTWSPSFYGQRNWNAILNWHNCMDGHWHIFLVEQNALLLSHEWVLLAFKPSKLRTWKQWSSIFWIVTSKLAPQNPSTQSNFVMLDKSVSLPYIEWDM